jgi:tetratricopeptide (TPR) repeat protein
MGRAIDYAKWGEDVLESIKYWDKAYELAMIPTYDKKGRAKYDTRTPNLIIPKLMEYYNSAALLYAGQEAYSNSDYSKAYEMYMAHVSIPQSKVVKADAKTAAKFVLDTNYYQNLYYAARFAYEAKRYDEALAAFELMNSEHAAVNAHHNEVISSNMYVYQIYMDQNDTTKAVEYLQFCINKFPEESWFVQNLINVYINSNKVDEALQTLDLAINREPNVGQYYLTKASVIAVILGKYEESFEIYKKATEIEPNNAAFWHALGIAYSDYATKINNDAAYLSDKEYKIEKAKSDAELAKALPYCQKAYELDKDNGEYKHTLRTIYYRLNMMSEYEALR